MFSSIHWWVCIQPIFTQVGRCYNIVVSHRRLGWWCFTIGISFIRNCWQTSLLGQHRCDTFVNNNCILGLPQALFLCCECQVFWLAYVLSILYCLYSIPHFVPSFTKEYMLANKRNMLVESLSLIFLCPHTDVSWPCTLTSESNEHTFGHWKMK